MITMLVTYAGDGATRFDRGHWINVHFPLVRECWGPYGLVSAAGFLPEGDGAGLLAVGVVNFRDEAALKAALASPGTTRIMADVKIVTDIDPARSVVKPL